ncbi:MAG TPA: ribosome maturation factor RimM [Geminicoccaceae bacterium]|nr:ribosome maturation factor RimM [Geminicoccaceae bacterium]
MAKVVAAHGVRGTLKLRCFTERPQDVTAYGRLHDRREHPVGLKIVGQTRGGVLATFDGIEDRAAAEALRGTELFVPRDALPEPGPDEFYHSDLEGLSVERTDGTRLGTVSGLENFGAGDLIEVADDEGRVLTLPFDRQTVPVVDLEGGRLVVEPPPELIPPAPAAEAGP